MIEFKELKKIISMQQDQTDCGVACLQTIIQFYGGSSSREELREWSGTTKQGATLLGLYQAASKLGFAPCGVEMDINELKKHKDPVILHVVLKSHMEHYVVSFGFYDDHFIIADPANGLIKMSVKDLNEIWKTKSALLLGKSKSLVVKKEAKRKKGQYFYHLLKRDRRLLIFSIVLGLIVSILETAMSVFSQLLIDYILPSKDKDMLWMAIVFVCVLLVLKLTFSSIIGIVNIEQAKRFKGRIVIRFYKSLMQLPKSFFDTRKVGDLVSRLHDTSRVQGAISVVFGSVVVSVLTIFVSLFFIYFYSPITGMIASVSFPFYLYLVIRYNNIVQKAQKKAILEHAESESFFINSIQAIEDIKNTRNESYFEKLNKLIYNSFLESEYSLGKIGIKLSVITGFFGIVYTIMILGYNSFEVYDNQLKLGELVAVLSISGILLPAIFGLALNIVPINEAKIAFDRMYEITLLHNETFKEKCVNDFSSLEIKNLSFGFNGREPILNNINIMIGKNQCVALIGESGGGKSTLRQIIQKYYLQDKGGIEVNGKYDLRSINSKSWRGLIGVVPQEISVFNGTMLSNIVFGGDLNQEKMKGFIKKYGFDEFIDGLPLGLETIIGEEGVRLSSGEKQLLAIMRALYLEPKLLILDECASSLDKKTEQFVINLLRRLRSSMSIFLISHRIQFIHEIANKIYVLEGGEIEDFGTHEELMESKNFYSNYWFNLYEKITLL